MQVALAAETNDSSSGTVEQQHTVRNSNGAYAEQAAVRWCRYIDPLSGEV